MRYLKNRTLARPRHGAPGGVWMLLAVLLAVMLCISECAAEEKDAAAPELFSHKTHAPLKLPCARCHTGVTSGQRARFPALAECAVCHTAMTKSEPAFPRKPGFRLPDFVYFSHQVHTTAKADCARCHGNVTEMHQVTSAVTMNMKFCVDCHTETKASNECYVCHELGQ
jgi:hypothetical protein